MSTTSDKLAEVASVLSWLSLQSHSHDKDGLPVVTHHFARDRERIHVRYDKRGGISTAWFQHRYGRSVIGGKVKRKMDIVLDWLGA